MQANPLWPVKERFPKLERDLRKDVLVVGGGMAGISSAFQLKKAGFDVALIERDEIGGPATGASSGVLYYGSGTNYAPAVSLFGREKADLLWKETAKTIAEITDVARRGSIECGLRTCGSIMVAKTEEEVKELETEQAGLRSLGLPTRLLSGKEVKDVYPLGGFLAGISFDAVGQVHPAQFAAGIARANQLEIYEGTPMLKWTENSDAVTVQTPRVAVQCSNLVLATNMEPCFGLEDHFEAESSVILASQPTDRVRDVFPQEKILWSMEDKYDIVYPRGDRLILELYALGDEAAKLRYYYPGIDFQIQNQWGESWAKTADWIPVVGKVSERITVAKGMGDQGIIMSWLSGSKVPDLISGKGDWFTEMASPSRFRAGAPAAVPTATTSEQAGETLDGFVKVAETSEIPVGAMKIFKVGGTEVFVANVGGSFYALPNKCTHAGGPLGKGKLRDSIVQCPLHGSKFDVKTGAVVGPPARVPEPALQVRVQNTSVLVQKPN